MSHYATIQKIGYHMNEINIISFSKDRAPQLEALLRSARKNVRGNNSYSVIYTCTNEDQEKAYHEVIMEYSDIVDFIRENGFQKTVLKTLRLLSGNSIMFTPDDGMYHREVDLAEMSDVDLLRYIPSIRLGKHLRECHPLGRIPQRLPAFDPLGKAVTWDWHKGEHDWGYPIALDGHIFQMSAMFNWATQIQFRSPTSFEVGLQQFVGSVFDRKGLCYEESRFVSLPWNVVTQEVNNVNGGMTLDSFIEMWKAGNRLDINHIYNTSPISCHQEYEVRWESKNVSQ